MILQLIMVEKGTMGEDMYQTCGAAILLLRLAQGMWNQSCRINKATLVCIVSWWSTNLISYTLIVFILISTATVLFADPQDVTVEANQWAQFSCTVSCSYTRVVGLYMAGYRHAIHRNNTIPGLLIKRSFDARCTPSNERTYFFEVYATEAFNKSTFYCVAHEQYHRERSCSCGNRGRCYSRPALLTGEPVCNAA